MDEKINDGVKITKHGKYHQSTTCPECNIPCKMVNEKRAVQTGVVTRYYYCKACGCQFEKSLDTRQSLMEGDCPNALS